MFLVNNRQFWQQKNDNKNIRNLFKFFLLFFGDNLDIIFWSWIIVKNASCICRLLYTLCLILLSQLCPCWFFWVAQGLNSCLLILLCLYNKFWELFHEVLFLNIYRILLHSFIISILKLHFWKIKSIFNI